MIVGLTGGIGSGKSTVAKMFEELGVPVYITDLAARSLIESSKKIKNSLIDLLGKEAIIDNKPNRPFIAQQVFHNKELLEKLNAIVHPEVHADFKNWYHEQKTPFVIKESAILFESGGDEHCDVIITVTAPKEIKIQRVLERDHTTKEAIEARMKNQWSDAQKTAQSDYVITNKDLENTRLQVHEILQILSKK
ncbi:dephospho-CoA kinase [Neptunitalea chrysea]|uniref:Dephospho-CoA kinase n=1 Tax=Neptunitalea chrysea TaxID=1647581 RepID=A0A9W6B3S2_9FLAO|nr:dephospho-CoA kinase [Neptunitalea chrysea]GLB51880.1 dephospho-CoA kinase [Neptunitalea chrysea]